MEVCMCFTDWRHKRGLSPHSGREFSCCSMLLDSLSALCPSAYCCCLPDLCQEGNGPPDRCCCAAVIICRGLTIQSSRWTSLVSEVMTAKSRSTNQRKGRVPQPKQSWLLNFWLGSDGSDGLPPLEMYNVHVTHAPQSCCVLYHCVNSKRLAVSFNVVVWVFPSHYVSR